MTSISGTILLLVHVIGLTSSRTTAYLSPSSQISSPPLRATSHLHRIRPIQSRSKKPLVILHSSSSPSDNTNNNPLPFFAAPSSFTATSISGAGITPTSSGPASSTTASTTPQSATVTLRLPLGTLFDGRDYIFVTESNVRGYEWTLKETDILLDDLIDAALGNLGQAPSPPSSSSKTTTTTTTKQTKDAKDSDGRSNPNANTNAGGGIQPSAPIITDYELSQIVLVPTSDWDPNLYGLGSRYDVYDGQQRLVTLNLILASLRDSFSSEANELSSAAAGSSTSNIKRALAGGKRAVALAATAQEISNMLVPTKVRKEDVLRITLRKRDNVILERILVGEEGKGGGLFDDDEYEENEEKVVLPSDNNNNNKNNDNGNDDNANIPLNKLTTTQKNQLLSPLSSTNHRILNNFLHLTQRIQVLTTRERLRLLDYMVERLYLLVCIPETSRIARNIVMAQGRKGMDNEPVDDFKGLVCFR